MTTMQLNPSQRAFCEAPIGNLRLLAPAGCGKTLCLLYRCKHLVERREGQRPRLLIVTFTRAARDELLSRVNEDDCFASLRDLTDITTLNSWGFRRVKNAAFSPRLITSKADYHFTVLNQLQSVWPNHKRIKHAIENKKNRAPQLIMNVVDAFKSIGFDHTRHLTYEQFSHHLDELDRQNLTWRLHQQFDDLTKLEVLESTYLKGGAEVPNSGRKEIYESFFEFWREATEHLKSNATFTLEDQKYFAYLDERQKAEEGSFLSGAAGYAHIFVDEFQDINPLDLMLIKAIAQRNRATVTIAGDDDQAIFEWRGSTPEYILDPGQFFDAGFETYTLGVNYRSPANIVGHSQRLIAHNARRVPKQIEASGKELACIEIRTTETLDDALGCVQDIIKESISEGTSPAKVAVIGRKRSQIIPYQIYFASKDIPFCAAEDLQIFLSDTFDRLLKLVTIKTRAEIRSGRAQVIDDIVQLCGFVKRYPLSKRDKETLRRHINNSGPASLLSAIEVLEQYDGPLKGKGSNVNRQMSMAMAEAIRKFQEAKTVSDTLMVLSNHFEGLHVDLGKAEEDIFYIDPPFLQLAEYASRYGEDYDQFVDDIELAKVQLVYTPPFEDDGQGNASDELWKRPVHLMTALRAKGKEFDTVVLLDVIEGIWPNRNAKTPAQLEAERRVFYVAFTRARQNIVMLVNNRVGKDVAVPSPYIEELGLSVG